MVQYSVIAKDSKSCKKFMHVQCIIIVKFIFGNGESHGILLSNLIITSWILHEILIEEGIKTKSRVFLEKSNGSMNLEN
jgi:hypothetical protein